MAFAAEPDIRECGEPDARAWDDLAAHEGSFYHRFGWRAINRQAFGHRGHYLAAGPAEAPTALLPLIGVRTRLFGRILCSMPFVNYGGPVGGDDATERALLAAAAEIAQRDGYDYIELRTRRPIAADWPAATHKVSVALTLDPEPERVWAAFRSKHRTTIRRAEKEGFTTRAGGAELLDDFHAVLARSWRAHGTPLYARRYFRLILDTFPGDCRLFVVYSGAQPIAAAFNGEHKGTVEGMWLGIDPAFRARQPNYVLYWEMIRDACERGFTRYHLGRSTKGSEAEQYKRKWNAETEPLYWHYYLPDGGEPPALNPDNPRFRAAIRIWRRLPLAATALLGPPLARGIP